ncbi:MAG: 4Fe-4S binding protein [Oscillospiraceae bacterium]|nr:4Fe-4S binding protein [Oscillospiraceae bacterium]
MIVYYSGTGNSKYAAKMLADILDDEVVDAKNYIRDGIAAELISGKPFVFVSPVYVSAPSKVFEDFIKSGSFEGDKRAWFVMTCAGGMGACGYYCEKLCRGKLEYMGTAQVEMPQNYLMFFKTKEMAENLKKLTAAEPRIRELGELIAAEKPFPDSGMKKWELISTKMTLDPYYKWFMKTKDFYATNECIGCGLCARSCPLGNIEILGRRPVWGDRCTHCSACINRCPKHAIEYGKVTRNKPRYVCPEYRK